MKPINLQQKLSKFDAHWHPHQIATVDNMQITLAKLKGEFVWHKHDNEDEFFQVIKGTLYMEIKDDLGGSDFKTEVIKEGEIIVIPKGKEHNPYTKNNEEVHVMLFEKKTIAHTGNVIHHKTKNHFPKI